MSEMEVNMEETDLGVFPRLGSLEEKAGSKTGQRREKSGCSIDSEKASPNPKESQPAHITPTSWGSSPQVAG